MVEISSESGFGSDIRLFLPTPPLFSYTPTDLIKWLFYPLLLSYDPILVLDDSGVPMFISIFTSLHFCFGCLAPLFLPLPWQEVQPQKWNFFHQTLRYPPKPIHPFFFVHQTVQGAALRSPLFLCPLNSLQKKRGWDKKVEKMG